jgi:ADP-ribosylglycohydrolase
MTRERYRGALLGLAAGGALGKPLRQTKLRHPLNTSGLREEVR